MDFIEMDRSHWDQVRDIFQTGIDTGNATFESVTPDWEGFTTQRFPGHRFVGIESGEVLGWITASPTSSREVYRGVVGHSVYVSADAQGKGIGRALLDHLIAWTETNGMWTIESLIFADNAASRALHKKAGFREVGIRERMGLMQYGPYAGTWRDVVLVERRSQILISSGRNVP